LQEFFFFLCKKVVFFRRQMATQAALGAKFCL
jgi:hypothetical protein